MRANSVPGAHGCQIRKTLFSPLTFGVLAATLTLLCGCGNGESTNPTEDSPASRPDEVRLKSLQLRDGLNYLDGAAEPFSGTAVQRFTNGQMAISSEFVDGKFHGKSVEWLKGGTKKRETLYRDGEAYFQTIWRNDGSKKIESEMRGDLPHGSHKRWHENGKLGFVGGFYEGKLHGLVEDRDEEGKLLVKARYDKGTMVEDLMPTEP